MKNWSVFTKAAIGAAVFTVLHQPIGQANSPQHKHIKGHEHSIPAPLAQPEGRVGSANTHSNRTTSTGTNNHVMIVVDFVPETNADASSDGARKAEHNQAYYDDIALKVKNYFLANSNNQLTVNMIPLMNNGQAFRLSQTLCYYGANDSAGSVATGKAKEALQEAIDLADPVYDFSTASSVGIFHAGAGEDGSGKACDIWSVRTSFPAKTVDGATFSGGTVMPSFYPSGSSIFGVTAHEYGHELGLPDLYDTSGNSEGIGSWGLMAGGSWGNSGNNPVGMEAWSKIRMGWITPTVISADQTNYQLQAAHTSHSVLKINASGTNGKEFFLIENRHQAGTDEFLEGSGLLILHQDDAIADLNPTDQQKWNNFLNGKMYLDVEEASGTQDLQADGGESAANDLWNSGTTATFGPNSTPNSNTNAGTATGITLSSIGASGATMTFNINLGFAVASATQINGSTVDVVFTSAVAAGAAATVGNYVFREGGQDLANPTTATLQADGKTVRLVVNGEFEACKQYSLAFSGIESSTTVSLAAASAEVPIDMLGTFKSGEIKNEVWTANAGPYCIVGDISVFSPFYLVIEAGTTVKFATAAMGYSLGDDNKATLGISGMLKVNGTAQSRVTFTSAADTPAPGDWKSVYFYDSSSDDSVVQYADFLYAESGLQTNAGAKKFLNNTFNQCNDGCMSIYGGSPLVQGNSFTNCLADTACIYVDKASTPIISQNRFLACTNQTTTDCSTRALNVWGAAEIFGNEFRVSNIAVGLASSNGALGHNAVVRGNSFIEGGWGVYGFTAGNTYNKIYQNYFTGQTSNAIQCNGCTIEKSDDLDAPVDAALASVTGALKTDNTFATNQSGNVPQGSDLFFQLNGTDGDSTNANKLLVKAVSTTTSTTGIYLVLTETGANTGIYRGSFSLGAQTNEATGVLGVADAEVFKVRHGADASTTYVTRTVGSNNVTINCNLDATNGDATAPNVGDVASIAAILGGGNGAACANGACDFDQSGNTSVNAADMTALVDMVLGTRQTTACGSNFQAARTAAGN